MRKPLKILGLRAFVDIVDIVDEKDKNHGWNTNLPIRDRTLRGMTYVSQNEKISTFFQVEKNEKMWILWTIKIQVNFHRFLQHLRHP